MWDKVKGKRLTYKFVINGYKAYNFERFALYKAPFISQGNDGKDKREYNKWLKEEHNYCLKDFPDYELHHSAEGNLMLVPYEIHKISHLGSRGVRKAFLFFMQ